MRNKIDNVNHKAVDTDRAGSKSAGRVAGKVAGGQDAGPAEPREGDVLEAVHRLMHEYRSLQYRFLRDGPHDITHMDGKVLGFFGARPGATQRDLAEHSGRDKAQLARLIKGLRDRGLLAGKVDAADRRSIMLSLTADGRAVQRALDRQAVRLAARAVAGLSVDEHRQLRVLLERVRRNLVAED